MNVAMMTRAALMAAVTAVAAQIAIPLPFSPAPFTLQVLAVILSGLLLGSQDTVRWRRRSTCSSGRVPVFAQFSGGLGVVLGPTGGYLLSYPLAGLAAHAAANATRRRALGASFVWGCAGLAIIYALWGRPGSPRLHDCPSLLPWRRVSCRL